MSSSCGSECHAPSHDPIASHARSLPGQRRSVRARAKDTRKRDATAERRTRANEQRDQVGGSLFARRATLEAKETATERDTSSQRASERVSECVRDGHFDRASQGTDRHVRDGCPCTPKRRTSRTDSRRVIDQSRRPNAIKSTGLDTGVVVNCSRLTSQMRFSKCGIRLVNYREEKTPEIRSLCMRLLLLECDGPTWQRHSFMARGALWCSRWKDQRWQQLFTDGTALDSSRVRHCSRQL